MNLSTRFQFSGKDRGFLINLLLAAWLTRFVVVIIFWATDAIFTLRLSPDSEKYHRIGLERAELYRIGQVNWAEWLDNGWFEFTGLIYSVISPTPMLIQLINISLGTATVLLVFLLAYAVYENRSTARFAAVLTAFFPSMVYWSCLMLKDPAAIFCVTLLVYSAVMVKRGYLGRYLVYAGMALLVLLSIRTYLAFVGIILFAIAQVPIQGRIRGVSVLYSVGALLMLGLGAQVLGFGFMGSKFISESQYFQLDYINHVRLAMGDHGSGAFFGGRDEVITWGGGWLDNIRAIGVALFYAVMTIDVTDLGSVRQLMALPEFLLILFALPPLIMGLRMGVRHQPELTWVLLVFAGGILAVYIAATTNAGAMFRWRTQIMPIALILCSVGAVAMHHGLFYQALRPFSAPPK